MSANKKSKVCPICGNTFVPFDWRTKTCSATCGGLSKFGSLVERFWQSFDRRGSDDCWLWRRPNSVTGYGELRDRGRTIKASRVSWEIHNGPIPKGSGYHGNCVMHTCDSRYPPGDITNRACVNPRHLKLGTHTENVRHADEVGRSFRGDPLKRSRAKTTKLSEESVRMVRKSDLPGHLLAKSLRVSESTISNIRKRKVWKHIA